MRYASGTFASMAMAASVSSLTRSRSTCHRSCTARSMSASACAFVDGRSACRVAYQVHAHTAAKTTTTTAPMRAAVFHSGTRGAGNTGTAVVGAVFVGAVFEGALFDGTVTTG